MNHGRDKNAGGGVPMSGKTISSGGTGFDVDVNVKKQTLKVRSHILWYSQLENIVRDVNAMGTRLRVLMSSFSAFVSFAVTLLFHDFSNSTSDQITIIKVIGAILFLCVVGSFIWWAVRPKSPMGALNYRLSEYSHDNQRVGGTGGAGTSSGV